MRKNSQRFQEKYLDIWQVLLSFRDVSEIQGRFLERQEVFENLGSLFEELLKNFLRFLEILSESYGF